MQVGEKIKKIRELKNYTQEYVANSLGMTQSAYSKIEKGDSDISYSKLEKVAEILQLRPEDIISFNEHLVFNVMHNQNGNGLVINQYADEVKILYERLLQEQKERYETEIRYLKERL